ncbi:hypothetical protein BJ742DRAFT_185326 [Cladochytrium replicatum]|nr:hypothetical protein BJ742DRAFT_185326 [Cladochytrium replicatum]
MHSYNPSTFHYYPDYYNYTTASTNSNYSTSSSQFNNSISNRRSNAVNSNRNLPAEQSHSHVTSPTSSTSSNSSTTIAVSRHANSAVNSPPAHQDLLSPPNKFDSPLRSSSPSLDRSASFNNDHSYSSNPHQNTNIYIRGLLPNTSDDWLYDLAKGFGTIVSHKAIIDLHTSLCKGYGFVMYSTVSEALSAMDGLATLGYQVSFAKESFNARLKNLQDEGSTNIYISNLPLDMTEEQLAHLFLPLCVISTKILREPLTSQSRGVGFVRLETREDAHTAIERFHSVSLSPGAPPLQVRFADTIAQKRLKNNNNLARKRSNGSNGGGYGGSREYSNSGRGSAAGIHQNLMADGFAPYGAGLLHAQAPPGYFPVPIPVPTPSGVAATAMPPNMVQSPPAGAGPYIQYPTAIYMHPVAAAAAVGGTSPVPIQIAAPIPSPYGSPYAPMPPHLLVPPFYAPGVFSSGATSTAGSDTGGYGGGSDVGEGPNEAEKEEEDAADVHYEGDDLDEVHRVGA